MTGRSKRAEAALGFRAHSGWACAVIVSGAVDNVSVVDRRRVTLCDSAIKGSKQPLHEAEPMPFAKAEAFIARCTHATDRRSGDTIAMLRTFADSRGLRLARACLITASGRALPDLRGILASHALIHSAEGEFYRDALARAAQDAGLTVSRVREKDAAMWSANRLGRGEGELRERLAQIGKALGPPWGADEKLATMAAWLALTE